MQILSLAAKVTATLDRNEISVGETFVLTIQTDSNNQSSPDLSALPESIALLSNSQQISSYSINGKTTYNKSWKLTLKALQQGAITIPPITLGNQQTQAITINVKAAKTQLDLENQTNAIFLSVDLDNQAPYVQQQVILTFSLYRAVATTNESLTELKADNAILEQLDKPRSFNKMINNTSYTVYQVKYALFPQKSGELQIPPVTFNAEIYDTPTNRSGRGSFFQPTRPISVSSKPQTIQVKARPGNAQTPWLPAEKLSLKQHWSDDTDIKVGEPITWTVSLSATGLSESQLPLIEIPAVTGLQIYPDSPQKQNKTSNTGLIGEQQIKFAVIPSQHGKVTIPEIKIPWWDVATDEQKYATLPARTLSVKPAAASQQLTPAVTQPLALPENPTLPADLANDQTNSPTDKNNLWQLISGFLALLWLTTLTAYWLQRKKLSNHQQATQAKQQAIKESNQLSLDQARQAVKQGDQQKIEQSLLALINAASIRQYQSLGAVCKQLDDPQLKHKLTAIEKARYAAQQSETVFQFSDDEIEQILLSVTQLTTEDKTQSFIPPLYQN